MTTNSDGGESRRHVEGGSYRGFYLCVLRSTRCCIRCSSLDNALLDKGDEGSSLIADVGIAGLDGDVVTVEEEAVPVSSFETTTYG